MTKLTEFALVASSVAFARNIQYYTENERKQGKNNKYTNNTRRQQDRDNDTNLQIKLTLHEQPIQSKRSLE